VRSSISEQPSLIIEYNHSSIYGTGQPAVAVTSPAKNMMEKPASKVPSKPEIVEVQTVDPLQKARELLNSGRSEEARDLLVDYAGMNSKDAGALTLLGQAFANMGCWAEAEECCNHAIQLNRLGRDAYYILALVLQHQAKIGPATEAMKKVVYIDRKDVLGHYGLADLYHLQGQHSHALKSLDNVFHLLENSAENTVIPNSGGITARHLREVVIHQQQQWSSEASGPAAGMNGS
jgi:tetratricopeptide (TPR) repeat protein